MKRSVLILLAAVSIIIFSQAQSYKYDDPLGKEGFDLKAQSNRNIQLTYSIHEFSLDDIEIRGESMKQVRLGHHFLPAEEGAPDLPGSGRYIALPQGSSPVIRIISMRKEIIRDVDIAPAPRIPKETERGQMEYNKNTKIYSMNAFYPASPVILTDPTTIRGVDAVILGITPFQYNPVTRELVVYRDIELEIVFEGGNGHFGEDRLNSRWWEPVLADVFLNYEQLTAAPTPSLPQLGEGVREGANGCEYLIICPDQPEFKSWADSLRLFRAMQGIITKVVTTAEIGGNNITLIENYINNAYNTWDIPPAAILLLGDDGSGAGSIDSPVWDNYCASDHIYADVNGDDEEEIVLARMTARNEAELEVMVRKVLDYETNPPTNPEFYNHPVTALGWQTERWFQICSEVVGGYFKHVQGKNPVRINAVYLGNPESDPWSTADNTDEVLDEFGPAGLGYIPASPSELGGWTGGTATEINNALNAGAFLIQHRDHGYEYGWGEPDYRNDDIDGLTNTDLSFIFSINCLTGKYNFSDECFAEKFHRYTYEGIPAGALGLLAASETSYSFVNDVYVWGVMDHMFPDFMPEYGTTPVSRGLLPAFGNAAGKIFLKYSGWPFNTENKEVTYNLFHHHGDAFTCLYSEVPQELSIVHDPIQMAGSAAFSISADEGSLIALSVEGELIGLATGTGTTQSIPIIAQNPPVFIDLVVTKQNFFRYHTKLQVIPPSGPYVVAESYTLDDLSGNNNNKLDYGETAALNINLKNLGSETAENVSFILSSPDEFVQINDDSAEAGIITPGEIAAVTGAFTITTLDEIPDGHIIHFNVEATDGDSAWYSTFSIKAHAPVLKYSHFTIDDPEGNNNGRLDPGETANLIISLENKGGSDAFNVSGLIDSDDLFIQVISDSATFGDIAYNSTANAIFRVKAIVITTPGHEASFSASFTGNKGVNSEATFPMYIGLFPILVLDLDKNNNSGDKIRDAIDDWRVFAEYSEEIPDDLSQYKTIFLCLGTYSDNHVLTETEAASFIEFLNNGGNLYMEGGDTWYYDQIYDPTSLHPMFNIEGLIDGYDNLMSIKGIPGTFTEGLNLGFNGDNNYIDHLEHIEPAFNILTNSSPEYKVAVAYDAGMYKTIGSSFEFGGIIDNQNNSKKNLMERYLTFFGMEPIAEIPEIPSGDAVICSETPESVYSTKPVEGALYYIWELNPPGCGTVIGWDTAVTINWTPGYLGPANLRVSGMNQNGLGPVSTSLLINHYELPTAVLGFNNTSICAGDTTFASIYLTGDSPWNIIISLGGNNLNLYSNKQTMEGIPFNPTADIDVKLVSVTDETGCTATEFPTINISVAPLPATPVIPNGAAYVGLLSGTQTTYSISGTENSDQYAWLLEPVEAGSISVSEDGLECTVDWVSSFVGEASLKVMGINDCGEGTYSDPLIITVANTYFIQENETGVEICVYPNPNSGNFNIQMRSGKKTLADVRISNTSGKEIMKITDLEINGEVNIPVNAITWHGGLYLLKIETKTGKADFKFIINR